MLETNKIHCGDCLELMPNIESGSIDMILADVPYGTTACKWDVIIPLEPMWKELKRIIKPNGAIVMTASQPFTSILVMSNIKWFRCEWIWDKIKSSNPLLAKIHPLKIHENILVFSKNKTIYNPLGIYNIIPKNIKQAKSDVLNHSGQYTQTISGYPKSIQKFSRDKLLHPTQKPVALMEYLIKTYTNENDIVLDFTMGSGTTPVACIKTNRQYIGIELDEQYCKIAEKRIFYERQQLKLEL